MPRATSPVSPCRWTAVPRSSDSTGPGCVVPLHNPLSVCCARLGGSRLTATAMSSAYETTPAFGVTVAAAGRGSTRFERLGALAQAAEAAGLDSVWTGDLYSRSATVPMAIMADRTERIEIASGIAYGVGRTPVMWAAEA